VVEEELNLPTISAPVHRGTRATIPTQRNQDGNEKPTSEKHTKQNCSLQEDFLKQAAKKEQAQCQYYRMKIHILKKKYPNLLEDFCCDSPAQTPLN